MAELIAFPFRLTTQGTVATHEDGSTEGLTEEIAVMCLTQPGERELAPEFGLPDASFGEILQAELESKIALFGPDVTITNVLVNYPRDGEQEVTVEYEPLIDMYDESEDFSDV